MDDKVPWADTYRAYAPGLARYARRLSRDDDDADEVVHDVFVRAMATAGPTRPEAMQAWLYRIATNLLVSRQRRRRRFRFVALDPESRSAEDAFDVEAEMVRRALRSIPADQAVALVLRLHEGRSRSQIADLLDLSEDGVKSRLVRGRRNFAAAYRRIQDGGKK